MGSNQSVDITNLTIIKAVQITPASSLRSLKDSTDPTMRKWIKTLLVSDRPEFQSLAQTNPVVVSLYLIIRTLQLIAILGNNIKTETLSSIYHGMFNSDFVPYIMLSPNSVDLKRYVLLGCSVCILSISAGLLGLKACGRANLTFKRYFFVPCCFLLALKTLTLVVAGIPIVYNCVLLLSNNLYQQFSIVDLCLVIGCLACLYLLVQLHSIFNFRTTFDQHPLLIHFV